jgi:hypothetical protein
MKQNFMVVFLSLLISNFLLFACISVDECPSGTVRFSNTSDNPYELYINGEWEMRIDGNTFTELDLPEGKHQAKVEQLSGYLLFPTIVGSELNVFGCQESQWIFP